MFEQVMYSYRSTPRGLSLLVRNENVYSDGKIKINTEAISSSNSGKKINSKAKLNTLVQNTNSGTLNHWSERPNDFTNNLILDSDGGRFHPIRGNHIVDSLNDSSLVLSISVASSYGTDSTKDSSAEDLSDSIFVSSSYGP